MQQESTRKAWRPLGAAGLLLLAAVLLILAWSRDGSLPSSQHASFADRDNVSAWRFSVPYTFTDSVIVRLEAAGLDGPNVVRELLERGIAPLHFGVTAAHRHVDPAARECLAEAIYHEARSQSVLGRLAVADVVLNRVEDRRFPASVCGVVYQGAERGWGCQFSFICSSDLENREETGAWEDAVALSQLILEGFQPPVTGFATYYHADYIRPRWASAYVRTKVIDDHVFYRPPGTLKLLQERYVDP